MESGGCSSMVEQKPSKLMTRVRFPSPAPGIADFGPCSSVAEHSLGKGEVMRSIRIMGTTNKARKSDRTKLTGSESEHGEEQIRAYQAARERRDDRPRGSRQDDADGGDDAHSGEEVRWG